MKVTKYPQSNLIVEENGKYLMIDPGMFTFEKFSAEDLGSINAILITHQHPDHFDPEHLKTFVSFPIYANEDVVKLAAEKGIKINPVQDQIEFEVESFKILPIALPHCKGLWCNQCNDKITPATITPDGKCKLHPTAEPKLTDGPPNTGYIINGTFFHPGDGIEKEGLKIRNAAIPIAGPTIYFEDAWKFIESLEAKKVIPVHYAGRDIDPNDFAKQSPSGIEVFALEDEESVEL